MAGVTLYFRKDPSSAQPRLEDPDGVLSQSERRAFDKELRSAYPQVVRNGSDGKVTFDAPARAFRSPATFRVQILEGPDKRCPDLRLELTSGVLVPAAAAPHGPPPSPAAWTDAWLKQLEPLRSIDVGRADQVGLEFAIEEVKAMAQRPELLAKVLFAGYLKVAVETWAEHDERRIGLYLLAERALDTVFRDLLPDAPEPQASHCIAQSRHSVDHVSLRWPARLLAWLSNLGDMP